MFWFLLIILIVFAIYWLFLSPYSQIFGKFPYKIKTKKKVVALTFDDGPNNPYTSQIVDFLDSKNIKATFFMVADCAQRHPKTTLKIHKSGHTIGIHSINHKFTKYFTQLTYKKEIVQSQNTINKIIGKKPMLFRPPWLWRQPFILKTLKNLNIAPVSGVFCYNLEVFQPKAYTIAKHTLAKVKPGLIIIFHDGYDNKGAKRTQTVEALKIVVNELIKQDYKFVTVNQLLSVDAYKDK